LPDEFGWIYARAQPRKVVHRNLRAKGKAVSKNASPEPAFEVGYDMGKQRLDITIKRYLQPSEGQAMDEAVQAAARSACRRGSKFDMLVDMAAAAPQTQSDIPRIQAGLSQTEQFGLKYCAIVIASTLLRLQVKRIVSDDRYEFFESISAAKEWLDHRPL
jgi:hypothetical protein